MFKNVIYCFLIILIPPGTKFNEFEKKLNYVIRFNRIYTISQENRWYVVQFSYLLSIDKISSTVFKTPSKRILLPTSDSPNRGKFPQKGMLSNLTSLGTNKLNIHPLCEVFVNKKSHIFILNDNKIVYHYFFEKIINLIHTGSLGQFCLQNIHSAVLLLKCP